MEYRALHHKSEGFSTSPFNMAQTRFRLSFPMKYPNSKITLLSCTWLESAFLPLVRSEVIWSQQGHDESNLGMLLELFDDCSTSI